MMQFFRDRQIRFQTLRLRGTSVFAAAPIVRRGEYVPRGANGIVRRVLPCGDYIVDFEGVADSVPVAPEFLGFGRTAAVGRSNGALKLTPTT